MKTLVVYYTRSGHTRIVADLLRQMFKADVEVIGESKSRKGILGFMRSGFESVKGKCPPINPIQFEASQYDLVILGGPMWAGNISSPLRTYLKENGSKCKKVAFFNVKGGDATPNIWEEMARWCRQFGGQRC